MHSQPLQVEKVAVAHYEGVVRTEWLRGGRDMKLLEDFSYIDNMGQRWQALKGAKINGASIPQPLWLNVVDRTRAHTGKLPLSTMSTAIRRLRLGTPHIACSTRPCLPAA